MESYEHINIGDYTYLGEGGQGKAYRHNTEKRLAKLFNKGYDADFAIAEFNASRAAFGLGVATPEPYRLITDGDRVGTEYELIENKRSFCRIISEEPSRLEEISHQFAHESKWLHALKADSSVLPSMKRRMQEFYSKPGVAPEYFRLKVLQYLEKIPDTHTFLHGDLQIGNIITDGRRTLWIDIGQCAYGAPEWDMGLCWRISNIQNEQMLDHLFHLTPELMQRHWAVMAQEYYGISADMLPQAIKRLEPYSAIKGAYMSYLANNGTPIPDSIAQYYMTLLD
ncbi:MAG: TIGR02172 family protein [Bacteroidales bacterium]|nr:TIGR02172 family protein [Bacteroidales bacterium]